MRRWSDNELAERTRRVNALVPTNDDVHVLSHIEGENGTSALVAITSSGVAVVKESDHDKFLCATEYEVRLSAFARGTQVRFVARDPQRRGRWVPESAFFCPIEQLQDVVPALAATFGRPEVRRLGHEMISRCRRSLLAHQLGGMLAVSALDASLMASDESPSGHLSDFLPRERDVGTRGNLEARSELDAALAVLDHPDARIFGRYARSSARQMIRDTRVPRPPSGLRGDSAPARTVRTSARGLAQLLKTLFVLGAVLYAAVIILAIPLLQADNAGRDGNWIDIAQFWLPNWAGGRLELWAQIGVSTLLWLYAALLLAVLSELTRTRLIVVIACVAAAVASLIAAAAVERAECPGMYEVECHLGSWSMGDPTEPRPS